MKIAICDDDKKICSLLENILGKYREEYRTPLDLDSFYSCEELIREMDKGEKFNLIYLDIEFPGLSGVHLGKYIREDKGDLRTEIVYMSGSDSYDRKLFNVQPLLFLAKPFKESEVIRALELSKKRADMDDNYFSYTSGNMIKKVSISVIIYFRSSNRMVEIVTDEEIFSFYGKLDEIENKLMGGRFIRIHKSMLINYKYLYKISANSVTMKGDIELPISRSYKSSMRESLINSDGDSND